MAIMIIAINLFPFMLRITIKTLTEGMVITLTYELNRYNLKVLECQPSQGISGYAKQSATIIMLLD